MIIETVIYNTIWHPVCVHLNIFKHYILYTLHLSAALFKYLYTNILSSSTSSSLWFSIMSLAASISAAHHSAGVWRGSAGSVPWQSSSNLPRGWDCQGGQVRSVSGIPEADHLGDGGRGCGRRGRGSGAEHQGRGRAEVELPVSDCGTRRREGFCSRYQQLRNCFSRNGQVGSLHLIIFIPEIFILSFYNWKCIFSFIAATRRQVMDVFCDIVTVHF